MTRVLVVDDNEDNRYLLRALLQGHGYEVEEAIHGAEALAKAQVKLPDLAISDLLMPELDGYSLLRHWRSDARLRGIPFIVYTATYTDARDERLALALGADAYLIKPAEPELLMARVEDVLGRRARGELRSAGQPPMEEMLLLKEYNDVLVRKLEKKSSELERSNRELTGEIAERTRTEERLRESEERFRATFEQAAVGIAHVDVGGRFLRVNDKLCEITGYPRDELIKLSFMALTVPEDRAENDGARRAMLAGRQVAYSVEKQYRKKDGRMVWVNVVTTLAELSRGGERYFITVVVDIAERKLLEEQFRQAQKLEAIGRLAGGVAHDFNNLLTVIFGCTDQILKSPQTGRTVVEAARAINDAGERASSLTAKLLGFGRQTIMHPRVLDLNEVIKSTVSLLQRLIGEDITLTTILGPDVDHIRIDPVQLDQVLMNLAVNARDAMPRGGKLTFATANAVVAVEQPLTHLDCRAGDYVVLSITDTGCGMATDVLERIFEPFFTTKEAGKGTGLGLAMVFGIVQQSGGCIHVASKPDFGSKFEIYFPALREPASRSGVDSAKPAVGGTETILLVEDNSGIRELAVRVLQTHGYKVLAAGNGEEALKLAQSHRDPIALVLTDVVMPKMSGPELAKSLEALFPETKFLYMSGYTDDAMIRHGLREASVAFLQKPFTPRVLVDEVRKALGQDRVGSKQADP